MSFLCHQEDRIAVPLRPPLSPEAARALGSAALALLIRLRGSSAYGCWAVLKGLALGHCSGECRMSPCKSAKPFPPLPPKKHDGGFLTTHCEFFVLQTLLSEVLE